VIREELKCFHTRVPFENDVLGIGISIKYHKTQTLEIEEIFSPLDLLSYTAFQEGVREAVYSLNDKKEKETFTHWLPLCTPFTLFFVHLSLFVFVLGAWNANSRVFFFVFF
jgi:hypothetical protein